MSTPSSPRAVEVEANITRFSGADYAAGYNANRPTPPSVIVDIVRQLLGGDIKVVVDLGSGTGLSTRFWNNECDEVVGVEPSDDMRHQAEEETAALHLDTTKIQYVKGHSAHVPLESGTVDVVVCSQSLHWMDPEPTFQEVARLLRPGGIFFSVDCDFPPVINVEAEVAYRDFCQHAQEIGMEKHFFDGVHKWDKEGHLKRMETSGRFKYCREIVLHNQEKGDAERLIGLALSQGQVSTVLKGHLPEPEVGVEKFKKGVREAMKGQIWDWTWSYRLRLAMK